MGEKIVFPGERFDPAKGYLHYARSFLDTMIREGTDRYGSVHSPMFASLLDMETHRNPGDIPDNIPGQRLGDRAVRGGVAVNPYSSLTLTSDVDITSNQTLVPGVKSQVLSLGAEQTILTEFLSFRIGAFKNMKDAQTPFTPTAGFGLRFYALRIDVGGGYDFREQGALASGSVSLTF